MKFEKAKHLFKILYFQIPKEKKMKFEKANVKFVFPNFKRKKNEI